MPSISPDELKMLLMRDLPHALVPLQLGEHHSANGHGQVPAPAKKGEHGAANLLATKDVLVVPESLADVALYLRDQLGYELLSNITAVDYIAEHVIELVYHFVHLHNGTVVIKTRLPRDTAVALSLTPFWPGANLQEREAFDLYGVNFMGHPELRRVYMWDEFEGFPMRKDFPKQGDKYFEEG